MRVAITGAGGFIGRALVETLLQEGIHDVVAVDTVVAPCPTLADTNWLVGDISDSGFVAHIFTQPCDALVHLATVPGGAAEESRALAQRVNLDATLALLEAIRTKHAPPRVVFASSIAVYGDQADTVVNDETPSAPRMVYGAQKAMAETWISTLTRRGEIDGLSLRLPGNVARPRASSGMKSAIMSNLFHAAKAGEAFTSPVSPEATMWLMSRSRAVQNFHHALTCEGAGLPTCEVLTLPNIRVSMQELVAAVARQADCPGDFVHFAPDEALEAAFGRQPAHALSRAVELGFGDDGSLDQLVANALSCI